MMRRLARVLLVVVAVAVAVYAGAWLTTDRFGVSRAIVWMQSDTGDMARFPARPIPAGSQTRPLPAGVPLDLASVWPVELPQLEGLPTDPEDVLEATGTTAFVVLQDGELRYERYFGGFGPEELQTSFSAAKSFVSTLVGLAIADGSIGSLDDPVTDYVPELAERDARAHDIRLRDLLTMSSGLRYVERSLPWSDDAQTYYGTDLRRTAVSTPVTEPAGRRFHYNNYNLLLEGLVLERATGMSVADYMSQRLWQPMGAEAPGTWSLDSTWSAFEKMESGLNLRPRDYARFGQLFLDAGAVEEQQVVPAAWVAQATARDVGPVPFYAYHWWTGDSEGRLLPDGHFTAAGRFGQFIYVAPDRGVVIVRLGSEEGVANWPRILAALTERL